MSATPPPMPPPPPPPPATRATAPTRWIFVLVGILTVILVIAAAGTALFFTRTWPPLAATYDFTGSLEDGDLDSASRQLCNALQSDEAPNASRTIRDLRAFADEVVASDSTTVDFFSVDRSGDEATVAIDVHHRDRATVTYHLHLVNEGDWRPCGLTR